MLEPPAFDGHFRGLDPRVQGWLAQAGLRTPSPPQALAFGPILRGEHVLLIAPTGMGKTEAAVVPIVSRLLRAREAPRGFRVLYITPLRALNRDMLRRMGELGTATGLTMGVRHGDTPQGERARQARSPPPVLITTPETVQLLLSGKHLRSHLQAVEAVVVDEIHELATDERGAQLAVALERVEALAGRPFQRVGLSATVGSPEGVARFLGGPGRPVSVLRADSPKETRVEVRAPTLAPEGDPVAAALAERLKVAPLVVAAIGECLREIAGHEQVLLFVNTRETAELLATRMSLVATGVELGIHHGSLSRDVRIDMENRFKARELRALICTSSLELGIDVGSVDFVIQYNSPREVARLLQRVGRGGHRIGETSRGVVIASNTDDIVESAVVADLARRGELERKQGRANPLGVLANQIMAMANSERQVDSDAAYALLRRSHPFAELPRKLFDETLALVGALGCVRATPRGFAKRGATPLYFFENISMIPDERTYAVIDIVSRRFIGTLDEAFVATLDEENSKFIVKGRSWRVAEVGEDSLLVEPSDDLGAVPSWVGEDIPVPFAVAQGVGAARRRGGLEGFPASPAAAAVFAAAVAEQRARGLAVPDDRTVTIEREGRTVIVNACLGTRVNETIGRALVGLLTQRIGASVGLTVDPYRILLLCPRAVREAEVEQALRSLDPDALEAFMRIVLKSSALLKWNLLHSAKKFGALRRGADHRFVSTRAIFDRFERTPLVEDAIDRTLHDRLDIATAAAVLRDLREGRLRVVHQGLSPIGVAGGSRIRELVAPQRADAAIIQALRRRLDDTRVLLVCMACRRSRTTTVREARPEDGCPHCGGKMQAVLHPRDRDTVRLLERRPRGAADHKKRQRLQTTAALVAAHGRPALLALAARGVGPDTAGRVLARQPAGEEELLKDLLAAEVLYARTRRFWS